MKEGVGQQEFNGKILLLGFPIGHLWIRDIKALLCHTLEIIRIFIFCSVFTLDAFADQSSNTIASPPINITVRGAWIRNFTPIQTQSPFFSVFILDTHFRIKKSINPLFISKLVFMFEAFSLGLLKFDFRRGILSPSRYKATQYLRKCSSVFWLEWKVLPAEQHYGICILTWKR